MRSDSQVITESSYVTKQSPWVQHLTTRKKKLIVSKGNTREWLQRLT